MSLLIENASEVVTCRTGKKRFKAGNEQSDIGLIRNSSIYIEGGRIRWLGKKLPKDIKKKDLKKIDAQNKTVMPGFIDSHTHLVFAGDRADEFAMRAEGKSYEEIAKAGGGILSTVREVRKASKKELTELAVERARRSIGYGVTTMEAKSGYGLDRENEIKMLEVIAELNRKLPIQILPTFLGAHAFPEGISREDYIDIIMYDMIPKIAKDNPLSPPPAGRGIFDLLRGNRLAVFIDAFCELNYFTPKETEQIFQQGMKFGFIPKLHTNQFYSIGGIEMAVRNKAISVDHLEVMKEHDISVLADSGIVACLLPGVSYFLNIPYAPARKLIEKNIPVAIATDFNPGTCMTENIQLIMSLAVQMLNMRVEETINAVTINAAAALGISGETGSIEPGKQADLVIFDFPDYRHLLYNFGENNVERVIKNGNAMR
jgi:imidazolonepropionase